MERVLKLIKAYLVHFIHVAMIKIGILPSVNYVSIENLDVNVKFLHPEGPATQFFCQI